MLIYVDFTEGEINKYIQRSSEDKFSEKLKEILICHKYSHHFIVIPRTLRDRLLKIDNLSSEERKFIKEITDYYTQNGNMIHDADIYINLKLDGGIKKLKNKIQLPLDFVNTENFLRQSILLVENMYSDGQILKFIIEKIGKRLQINLNFELAHGGGETIVQCFNHLHINKRFGVCVIDSDKKFPLDKISDKNKTIQKIINSQDWPLMRFEVMPCREIENIIPYKFIEDLECAKKVSCNQYVSKIIHHEKKNKINYSESFWLYFDIKNGIKRKENNDWLVNKINGCNIKYDKFPDGAYGNNVLNEFIKSDENKREFANFISSDCNWKSVFYPMFTRLCWHFRVGDPKIT